MTNIQVNMSVQMAEMDEGKVDDSVGEDLLKEWAEQSSWFPDNFPEDASIENVELVVAERRIDRAILAEEYTEKVELSESEYRKQKKSLQSPTKYKNREGHVPADGEWSEGTLLYEVPNSHRESNCRTCSGTGRLSCQNCNNNGKIHCPNCGGTGRQETKRECTRCEGYGKISENVNCGQCAGKGYEIIDDQCPKCRGTGEVTCSECGGSGELRCNKCNGEGITHKLEILYRECTPKIVKEHTTYGIPEKHIEGVSGRHVRTDGGTTNLNQPKHEIEHREIDVLQVDYSFEEDQIIGGDSKEKEYSLYYVEGGFKKDDYPKNQTRKLLPVVGIIALVIVTLIILNSMGVI